jgi:hypothetical protein
MVSCNTILDNFQLNYGIATVFTFAYGKLKPDVISFVYVFFTTGNIETRCKHYFILLFASNIPSTVVKSLIISQICSSCLVSQKYN